MTEAPAPAHRDGFHSLRGGGLNWDSLPLKLFAKGNAKFWNPADIDLVAARAPAHFDTGLAGTSA